MKNEIIINSTEIQTTQFDNLENQKEKVLVILENIKQTLNNVEKAKVKVYIYKNNSLIPKKKTKDE